MRLRFPFRTTGQLTPILVSLSLTIGVGAGFGAVGFRWLIGFVHAVLWGHGAPLVPWTALSTVLIPGIGGALVGPLTYFLARETKGHGVPEVMLAVAKDQGRMRFRVVFVKALASALCLGSGGSAGREGPIVQIGSALGSGLGRLSRVPPEILRTLVAAGAAGGISATFNAPIAGVFFALEVILQDFSARAFSLVVLSSVTATVISRILLGPNPAFSVPPYAVQSPWEFLFYAALGGLAALVAKLFTWALYRCEDLFDAWQFPEPLKPAVGGLCVGAVGVVFPQVLGVGYETLDPALRGQLALPLLGALLVAKLLVTSLTLGSGGSGGVFSPSLFMGAMLGGALAGGVHRFLPALTASAGASAVVGMAAVFAAAAQAPITSVLIIFEMTGDYRMILPLMLAVGVSTLLAHFLGRETIYTLKLARRGIDVLRPTPADPLDRVRVADAMVSKVITFDAQLDWAGIVAQIRNHPFASFPVTDETGALVGILGYRELREALTSERRDANLTARDLMLAPPPVSYPDESLSAVLERFQVTGVGRLPVVSRRNPQELLGIISLREIFGAYQRATAHPSAAASSLT